MYICEKCGQVYAAPVPTCAICGCDVIKQVVEEPVVPPVTVTVTPQPSDTPRIPGGARAKGIVGFVMSLEGIVCSVIYGFYSVLFAAMMIGYSSDIYGLYEYGTDLEMVLLIYMVALICQIPVGIISFILSKSARNSGYVSRMTSAGKVLGILTTIISAVAVLLLLMALSAL